MPETNYVHVIDSHTGGEPTRIIIEGGPKLKSGPLHEQVQSFRSHFDRIRSAIVEEPRGSEAIVGALLCAPTDLTCVAGVIFFNNVDYLGMCGHGTIGLAVTLAHLKRIAPGHHRIETPVGIVDVELHSANEATVYNVPSERYRYAVSVDVPGIGTVIGDVAWGGNWFFLTDQRPCALSLANLSQLTEYTIRIRTALENAGITGRDRALIDHIELYGPPTNPSADSKNFVLCPGGAYDRSPCGTGTSAKLACLYAEGKLQEGETWRQESLIGSIFEASYRLRDGMLCPQIRGTAYVTAESKFLLNSADPFCWGIPNPKSTELD